MNVFRPSAAFQSYYQQVMALVAAPITPGLPHASIPMPNLPDFRERTFATTKLAPLVDLVNTYRDSVPPIGYIPPATAGTAIDYSSNAP